MSSENQPLSKRRKIVNTLIIVLSLIFLLALVSFVRDFLFLNKQGFLEPSGRHHENFQVQDVERWMTFAFLNRIFGLPPEYLKEELEITNKHYPNLTIKSWAKEKNVDPREMTEQVKKFIEDFKKETPPPAVNSI